MNLGMLGALGGIGQGISGVGQQMLKESETQDAEARQMRLEEWRAARNEEYAIQREERATKRDEEKSKRLVDDTLAARKKAEDAPVQRDIGGLLSYGRQKFGVDAEMSEEDKQTVRDMPTEARKIYEEAGAVKARGTGRLTPAMDMFNAAQETGNTTLIGTALKGVDDARAADATDATNAFRTQQEARREAEAQKRWEVEQERLRISDRNADTAARRVEGAIAKASGSSGKPEKLGEIEKMELQDLRAELRDAQKAADSALGKKAKDAAQAKVDALKAEYNALKDEVNPKPRSESSKPSTSKPAGGQLPALPTGAKQIGTSGGKPVYETPDGKRFIQR